MGRRGPNAEDRYLPDAVGRLETQCWCGRHFLLVPAGKVRAGKTAECDDGCRARGEHGLYDGVAQGRGSGRRRKTA